MKTTVEKLENNKVALHIEVDKERIEAEMNKAYRRLVNKYNIPGFRRGRAPRVIFERYIGRPVLLENAIEHMLPEVYKQAVEETGIHPIDQPGVGDINFESIEEDQLKLKVAVEVIPEVKLGTYVGIPVERTIIRVTEDEVEDVLKQMQNNHAQLEAAEHEQVQNGDFVTLDYEGLVDGKPFQGGARKNYLVEVGSGQLLPEFEKQLLGAEIDEERTVELTFPDDYYQSSLAGKKATFKVKVHNIQARRLPPLDDDFAKDVGNYENLEALRREIREDLEAAAVRDADNRMRQDLITEAVRRSETKAPESLIKRETERLVLDTARYFLYRGIAPQGLLDENSEEGKTWRERLRPQSEQTVLEQLVLDAIARREGIDVGADELDAEIERRASGDNVNGEEVRRHYADPEVRENLRSAMRINKAVDFLVEKALITEKTVERPAADSAGDAAEGEEKAAEQVADGVEG
jgi:trigger factor